MILQFSEVISLLNAAVNNVAKDRILSEFARHVIDYVENNDDGYDLVQLVDVPDFAFSDEFIRELWEDLGNIPVIEDAQMLQEYIKEMAEDGIVVDATLLNAEGPYIDEDFFLWKRGTLKYTIWQWFNEHYLFGVQGLVYEGWELHEATEY